MNPPLQKILTGILNGEDEKKHSYEKMGILNLKRRADKYSESSTDLVTYAKSLTQ
jgi:hypothetical protein